MKPRKFLYSILFMLLALGAAAYSLPAMSSSARMSGSRDVQMQSPARLTTIADGNLLVTDYNSQAVIMVNRSNLKALRAFAVEGRPLGIAWARGRVYVGNETTGTVEVYNPAGKWLYDLGGAKGLIKEPSDIAVDERLGRIFVVDGGERNIKVFDLDGTMLSTISGTTTGAGQMINPTGIALDEGRGEVLVSDYGDPASRYPARIHIFDYAGNYLTGIAGRTGGFSRPQGMAVESGHIFLADGMLGQVLVFDRETGARVKTLGSFGAGAGQLQLPLDVTVDEISKDVFVTNNRLGRVELFREGGLVP